MEMVGAGLFLSALVGVLADDTGQLQLLGGPLPTPDPRDIGHPPATTVSTDPADQ